MTGKMDAYGQTDIGCKREHNEDQFLIADLNKAMRVHRTSLGLEDGDTLFGHSQGVILLVADGMGGHAHGEQASRLAVESLTRSILNTIPWFFSSDPDGDEDLRELFDRAIKRCQERLQCEAEHNPSLVGMGTTLTAAYLNWPRTTIMHAGDSRCYLYRNGDLSQITTDHTVAEKLAHDDGKKLLKGISERRWAHILWNAIGSGGAEVEPEVHQLDLQLGDTLLLCTDGLIRNLADKDLREQLSRQQTSQELCSKLIDMALSRGGDDNITVVAARFVEPATAERMAAEAAAEEPLESVEDTVPEVAALGEDSLPAGIPST